MPGDATTQFSYVLYIGADGVLKDGSTTIAELGQAAHDGLAYLYLTKYTNPFAVPQLGAPVKGLSTAALIFIIFIVAMISAVIAKTTLDNTTHNERLVTQPRIKNNTN